ncbi:MAG: hypothetical protein Q8K67_05055 [Geothrix sp.]|nr:hypothetical protein [Geothrix sp.]
MGPGAVAQDFNLLPEWARPHARAAALETPPSEADAWVLLDRTEIAYSGDGEVKTRRLKVIQILTERGLGYGTFFLGGLGGGASKVKRLKGWNLRADGALEKLDQDTVITLNASDDGSVSTRMVTAAALPRVAKGSLVAFESLEVFHHPMGPVASTGLLEDVPIRRWEMELVLKAGWFSSVQGVEMKLETRHFPPWIPKADVVPGQRVMVSNLPALPKGEEARPHAFNNLPAVYVRFLDPALKKSPSFQSWDAQATWIHAQYTARAQVTGGVDLAGKNPLDGLKAIHAWMGRDFTYKQVYLTPDRGWVPESAAEIGRKKYGDCKDLTVCLLAEAGSLGLGIHPVLARINEGEMEADMPPSLSFNHVIAGLRLSRTLGLSAEVETPGGRFLLVDPTDPATPIGKLSSAHRGRRVMICTEQGAIWAMVPDAAILQPHIRVELKGAAEPSGLLTATLRFVETSDKLGLRSAAMGSGKLQEFIARTLVDLPATGSVQLVSQSDPRDFSRPFEVVVKAVHPDGFHRIGQEGVLVAWGLPGMPPLIQRAGKPRIHPVVSRSADGWDYQGEVTFPLRVQPVLAEKAGETPFRSYAWTASVENLQQGGLLRLVYHQARKDAVWNPPEQEKGVSEWKKDRAIMRQILEDGLSVRVLP